MKKQEKRIPGLSFRGDGTPITDVQIQKYINEIKRGKTGKEYGYKKVTAALRRQYNLRINKKKVYRLMFVMGLLKLKVKAVRKYKRICKNHVITGSNQLWEMDIKYAYIAGERKVAYIASIIDVFDRSIVAYSISLSCTAEVAKGVLIRSLYSRGIKGKETELVIRTDNGTQFISYEFERCCIEEKVFHERIPVKSPNFNAHIEAYHRYLQDECLKGKLYINLADLENDVEDYVYRYNEERLHSSIGYMTPNEFYYDTESKFKKNYTLSV